MGLREWLAAPREEATRAVMSLQPEARPFDAAAPRTSAVFLSGPEGGLTGAEESLALAAGFTPVSLGPRTLRADTAPLAVLAALSLAVRA
jgi:16S rRNA (uracil1498-N3)-methyltransferase